MYCTYPNCNCIVSTSTSQPEPVCPRGLEASDIHNAIDPATKEVLFVGDLDECLQFWRLNPQRRVVIREV
jgi:hypothetical protein